MAATDLPPDPTGEPLVSKGLVEHLDNMRQRMSLAASDRMVTALGFGGVPHRRAATPLSVGTTAATVPTAR